jgi:putative ABC transport system permease protein
MSIGLMIGSFRSSLIEWIDSTLTADLYLAIAPDREAAVGDADWVAAIEALPEIRGTSLSRRSTLPSEYGEIGIRAATPGPDGWGLDLVGAAEQGWEEKLRGSDRVIVSEPFAYRHSLQTGDSVVLPTQSGNRTFRISGIVRDYNAAGNAVVMGLETYHRHWRDPRISGIGLHLAEGADPDRTKERVLSVLPRDFGARVRSTAMIERLSLTIFDRTFEVTSVLRTLAGFVAFLGVLSAILALQLEREREFAVLRSIGMSLAELRLHIVAQTGLLGLAAGLIAIPLGCALAWMLVYVINRRSFGWSMDFIVSVPPVFYGVAIAIGAALLAGFYAALFGMRPDPGKALHDE